jgi:tetratricopeptide (TPR) repeat protein
MVDQRFEHYKRGLRFFGENKHEQAIAEYQQALAIAPDWPDALHGLAMASMHLGRIDEAIAAGRRLIELDAEDPLYHTSLSMFYQRKGLIPEAEQEQAKARMLNWKRDLKTNPNAPPPEPGIKVVQ